MADQPTQYCNTDLNLMSNSSLALLAKELEPDCDVLHCAAGDDGNWHMTVESSHGEITANRSAELDIPAILDVIAKVSRGAREQFDSCFHREFNIGFECGDSWGYNHQLPLAVLQSIVGDGCTVSMTLYPMRNPDGTLKDAPNAG